MKMFRYTDSILVVERININHKDFNNNLYILELFVILPILSFTTIEIECDYE